MKDSQSPLPIHAQRDFSVTGLAAPTRSATPEQIAKACSEDSMELAMEKAQMLMGDSHPHRIYPTMLTILSTKFNIPTNSLLMPVADYLDSIEFEILYEESDFKE